MLTDSAISLACFAPPRSFAALMTLYESNYIRLRALMPCLVELARRGCDIVSYVPEDLPLHASIRESSRYTHTLQMTYFFDEPEGRVADPDLHVRVYHDARMAEVLACGTSLRHPLFGAFEIWRGSELERRWARNMMLNKWLEYCTDRGHRLGPAVAVAEAATTLAL